MKKLFAILFTFFYLSAASGVTLHMHYCMGELVNVDLLEKEAKQCGGCEKESDMSSDCCDDAQQEVKIEKTQQASYNLFNLAAPGVMELPRWSLAPSFATDTLFAEGFPPANGPPPVEVDRIIRHCTFLI